MEDASGAGLSGRRAEASRNDERILEAAREVFVADPSAPIANVAEKAGVGISALYRRYPSKEDLLRQLNREGLQRYIAAAETAVGDDGDAWAVFSTFMRRIVEADTHSLTQRLAGTFVPTDDLYALASRAQELNVQLFDRTLSAGAIRHDVTVDDLGLLFEQVAAIRVRDTERTKQLRSRYLQLVLQALHAPSEDPLPGPPPTWMEIAERWEPTR
jgi:AcrR family transcriptional regulator